jgi:hypothetical protein
MRRRHCTTSSQQLFVRSHNVGLDGTLDTVLELPDRRTALGMRTRVRLDNFLSSLGGTPTLGAVSVERPAWPACPRAGLGMMPQQVVLGPGDVGHLNHHCGPHPVGRATRPSGILATYFARSKRSSGAADPKPQRGSVSWRLGVPTPRMRSEEIGKQEMPSMPEKVTVRSQKAGHHSCSVSNR